MDPMFIEPESGLIGFDEANKKMTPGNKLSEVERKRVLSVTRSPELRDLSPCQIVPLLADKGELFASESTFYRVLREEGELNHRDRSKPRTCKAPKEKTATGPCQIWSWDITWSTEVRLNDDVTTNDQCFPTLSANGSTLQATWYDRRLDPGNLLQDTFRSVSTDGGLTWDANERLSDVSTPIEFDTGDTTAWD